jgi:hypothetical protein
LYVKTLQPTLFRNFEIEPLVEHTM